MLLALCLFLLLIPGYSFAEGPPTVINAEMLEYSGGVYTARGNVVITRETKKLTASTVTLNNNTGDVKASGNVEFVDGDNSLSTDSLLINFRSSFASINHGRMFIKEDNYHIEGELIERLSEDRYHIKSATFTTCDGDPPCWRFKGRNINIHLNHILSAQGVSFSVLDVPLLYLPYIALPITQERQTGLLIPRVGYNTGEGLKVNNAFFWAMSESQDSTIYADYYGEKGWGSGLEYRYILTHDTRGQFNGYYINDNQIDKTRWDIKYNHRQLISDDLSARLRVNYLNDKTLYKDISEDISERLLRTQDSDLYINRRWDPLSIHLWGQYTQDLSGESDDIFQRLPEAGLRVMDNRISTLPVYWSLTSSASRWEEANTGLTRLHLAPEISFRFPTDKGFVFIPRMSTEQTFYYMNGNTDPVRSSLYNVGASISTKFYKRFTLGSGRAVHFIEPDLNYEYTEGLFTGTPRLLDPVETFREKNIFTLSLINRIVSVNNVRRYEPLYVRLTQAYRINSLPFPHPPPRWGRDGMEVTSGLSELRIEAIIRLRDRLSIDADTTYNHEKNSITSAGTDLKFRRDRVSLSIGQRYSTIPSIEFTTASAGLGLYKIDASADFWYDNKDHRISEADYAIIYSSQCWGATLTYKYRPEEEQFNVLLTLKGLGSVGGF